MSEIKNGGLDQYGAGPFEQHQCGTAGIEGVKVHVLPNALQLVLWRDVSGLDEISAELRTVDNYTQLLQTDQQALRDKLTESKQEALALLQCQQLPANKRTECNSIRQEVMDAGTAMHYLQVTDRQSVAVLGLSVWGRG